MDERQLLTRYAAGERAFPGLELKGAQLRQADLVGIDLQRAKLANAELGAADLENAKLAGADLQGADLRDANLQGADLQNANLRGARLQHSDLREALVRHAFLQHAVLTHSDLRGADFRDADLGHADLSQAQLQHADLRGANLQNADLRGADLLYAELSGADLTGATLDADALESAEWTADQLSELIAQGAEVSLTVELAEDMRRVLMGQNLGLTLYFDAPLNALERLILHAVVVAVLGADTSCAIEEHTPTRTGWRLRLSGEDADLRRVADALAERIWENKVREQQEAAIPFADLLPRSDRLALSLLIDKADRYELYRAGPGGKPVHDRTWTLGHTRERRLGTLWLATLGAADLRRWLSQAPGGRDLVAGLPGPQASGKAFAQAAAEALTARDAIAPTLFAELVEAHPNRRADIAFVARLWDFELPAPRRSRYD